MRRSRRAFSPEYRVEAAHRVIDGGRAVAEVEQVVEPAAGIGRRPTVKLGLHLRYPPARPRRVRRRGVTVRWRVFRHCSIRSFSKTAAALRHVTGFPGLGLLRRLRPTRPVRRSVHLSRSGATGLLHYRESDRMVPVFTVIRSTKEEPDCAPAALPTGTP